MAGHAPAAHEQPRAVARRKQVVEAATQCFRRSGFHGTSIARISRAAGMSVGHIYHYFENKEAIVAAIVERDLLHLLTISERIRRRGEGGDILRAMVDEAESSANECVNDPNAPLMLEIVAEAARNPEVAAIVRAANEAARRSLRELLREGLRFRGIERADSELDGPIEVIAALFEGLSNRAIRNPDLDPRTFLPALRGVMEHIVETLAAEAGSDRSA